MSEESKREQERAEKRANAAEGVRVWNPRLTSQMTAIKECARREWNFDNFFNRVKRIAPSVSREELREFVNNNGIALRNKPKPSGRVV